MKQEYTEISKPTNQQVLKEGPLLDDDGNLVEAGYALQLVKQYKRNQIKAYSWRIKQWDYYYVGDQQYAIALTIADLSYTGIVSVSIIDFLTKREFTKTNMSFFPFGSFNLPESSQKGNLRREGKGFKVQFNHCSEGKRQLVCHWDNFRNGENFNCDIQLEQSSPYSTVIATPFKQHCNFYYNQKINLLKGKGSFILGNVQHTLKQRTYGVLDWGRGVWPYNNTWYWSSINGEYNGHLYGFNLGYGFGDTSKATENMFFFDKQAYKLDDIIFSIPQKDNGEQQYLHNWSIRSLNGSVNIQFKPMLDRHANINFVIFQSVQHQVFGIFNGTIKIDSKTFNFQNLIGFAEKVKNRW